MAKRPLMTAGAGDDSQDSNVVAAQKRQRDQDRATSVVNASKTADKPKWNTDDDFMKALGKEGIKRQQEKMQDTADYESTKHNIPSYKKGGKIRKTGLAYMHKGEKVTPVKKSPRKRG